MHDPLLHKLAVAQIVPHAPQLELSLWRSTHLPPQFVYPATQVTVVVSAAA